MKQLLLSKKEAMDMSRKAMAHVESEIRKKDLNREQAGSFFDGFDCAIRFLHDQAVTDTIRKSLK